MILSCGSCFQYATWIVAPIQYATWIVAPIHCSFPLYWYHIHVLTYWFDRLPWQVKSAILSTLTIIIRKGGISLKPFIPQLQTIFVKCLQDSTRLWLLFRLTCKLNLPLTLTYSELLITPEGLERGANNPRLAFLELGNW